MAPVTELHALDLRKEYPRSPNTLLGHYVILARTIDKCRAELAGTQGQYHWNCPVAKVFFDFTGIDPMDFKEVVAQGANDHEILEWIKQSSKPHTVQEIQAWSYDTRWWKPDTVEMKAFLESTRQEVAPKNYQIQTFFQLIDAEEGRL